MTLKFYTSMAKVLKELISKLVEVTGTNLVAPPPPPSSWIELKQQTFQEWRGWNLLKKIEADKFKHRKLK